MRCRRIVVIRGTVQGVGFRPFVYRTAVSRGLTGAVWNESGAVVVDVEGDSSSIEAFVRELRSGAPAIARVEAIDAREAEPAGRETFSIVESRPGETRHARLSPDLAACPACLGEMSDPADRRSRYPFINCTDCGPRYSIVRELPYDRPRTTMASFTMCEPCAAEYAEPSHRRYHAQPTACPDCGPRLTTVGLDSSEDPVGAAVRALRRGAILAVKGLGGFHLACDATNEAAVQTLRRRKARCAKPFAVMFPTLAALEQAARVGDEDRRSLASRRAPIVLLKRGLAAGLAPGVAPGLDELGAVLPYTPLHHRLLAEFSGPLVMTSGNRSEEPIVWDNQLALQTLGPIADAFLLHDRDIVTPSDDSVVRSFLGHERLLRRARGYVPDTLPLCVTGPGVFAAGGDLKSVFCLAREGTAVLSQHLGDLDTLEAQRSFETVREHLQRLFDVTPRAVAHDLHPDYHSTRLALDLGLPAVAVQHHHAHIASCLVDNGRNERVIGVAWDGAGFGPDGTIWGGEFLVADLDGFERAGRLRPVPMVGGDLAAREPWRLALAHAVEAGQPWPGTRSTKTELVEAMVRKRAHTTLTSSAGRLFDAVACLARLRETCSYEGQAAMELEAASLDLDMPPYPLPVIDGSLLELDARPTIAAVMADARRDAGPAVIGCRFHSALASAIEDACRLLRARSGIGVVALSGGCFQNARLAAQTVVRLESAGFEVLLQARVPCGDGGLALGQAAIATRRLFRQSLGRGPVL
ncbi:MAG: carbamoyltransferase HypF [Candidatus Wallbacteria bacterium]|nr:carbamoyltransferase HypF [Candidatus Wallbacteria bacterium]